MRLNAKATRGAQTTEVRTINWSMAARSPSPAVPPQAPFSGGADGVRDRHMRADVDGLRLCVSVLWSTARVERDGESERGVLY